MAEKFFWADAIADQIVAQRGTKDQYVCASGIGVSGLLHIGNFRDAITTDMVVRALRDKGCKVRFIYSWDDFDRFRKVPANVPSDFEQYVGMPVSDLPSPFDASKSYTQYFEERFIAELERVGVVPEFISQAVMNRKCAYADLLKVALDNREKIISMLDKYREKPLASDWYPITVYCDVCKKDSTRIIDVSKFEISYECECGHSEKFDFRRKGLIKAKWRIDWPLRWKFEGVDFEPGGNDLSVYGGSFMTGKEICREVFGAEPPHYTFYDWIRIKGGKEFSGSSGNALTVSDVLEVYTPELLRYLFVGKKPKSSFDISFDNDVIALYDSFDRLEEKYFSGSCNPKEKRMYEMSMMDIPASKPQRSGFRHLVTLVQIGKTDGLNELDVIRAERVAFWLEKYAGDDMKFSVNESVTGSFSKKEKLALKELETVLRERSFGDPKDLFDQFYDLCERVDIKNSDFFSVAYRALIGMEKGPRLADFILSIGQEKVLKLLKTIK